MTIVSNFGGRVIFTDELLLVEGPESRQFHEVTVEPDWCGCSTFSVTKNCNHMKIARAAVNLRAQAEFSRWHWNDRVPPPPPIMAPCNRCGAETEAPPVGSSWLPTCHDCIAADQKRRTLAGGWA